MAPPIRVLKVTMEGTEALARKLDPDRLYPVYGDAGTVTWDAESQGKFYLALEAD